MANKQVRAQHMREFKQEAVRQVRSGQSVAKVAKVLGITNASLGNWVRLGGPGHLGGFTGNGKEPKVTAEQMEISRLRAENTRLRMGLEIVKKWRRTSHRTCCEVRLD